jgi:hypothetical protein
MPISDASPLKTARICFVLGLLALFIRNIPLSFLMPIWAHGDEIGHLDCIIKIGRGQIPYPGDRIDSSLFRFHRARWDGRIMSEEGGRAPQRIEDMGLAGYSYEASQPPLPHILLAMARWPLKSIGLQLQVRLLRCISPLVLSLGLLAIFLFIGRRPHLDFIFTGPLLFIPLLAHDTFFSINTDVFSFLFGTLAVLSMLRLAEDARPIRNWIAVALWISCALWTKTVNAFLLVLWILLVAWLLAKRKDSHIAGRLALFGALTLILSAPWYVFNYLRFSNPFIMSDLPYPFIPAPAFSLASVINFFKGFLTTLFRGELFWHGRYFDPLPQPLHLWITFWAPLVLMMISVVAALVDRRPERRMNILTIRLGVAGLIVIMTAHFIIGQVGYYNARYTFGGLLLWILLWASGWRTLIPQKTLAVAVPAAWLAFYNIIYCVKLLQEIS